MVPAGSTTPIHLTKEESVFVDEDIHIDFETASRSNTEKTYAEISEDGKDFMVADSLEYDTPDSQVAETHEIVIDKQKLQELFGRLQPDQVLYIRLKNKDLDGAIQYP